MLSLDDPKFINKYDKSRTLGVIGSFPRQCLEAERIGSELNISHSYKIPYRNIVCAGLGGSAAGSDILRAYLWNEAKVPLFVNRNYLLPAFTGRRTLVIASSYSGDTEETLSAYRDAKKRRAKLVVVTSGGRLRDKIGRAHV